MFGGYPRKKGYQRKEIAAIARIDEDTVANYILRVMPGYYSARL